MTCKKKKRKRKEKEKKADGSKGGKQEARKGRKKKGVREGKEVVVRFRAL